MQNPTPVSRRHFRLLLLGLFVIGFVARVAPLFDEGGRMLEQYPSEDGYLMLTIARNLALGNGMSTAEGTLPTNGTQPLVNFLWAGGFWLFDADRRAGVLFAQVCQVFFSALCALLLFRLGKSLLAGHRRAFEISGLASAAWYATMLSSMHGMNCLETGAYALGLLAFAHVFVARREDPLAAWSAGRALALGVALGLVFWIRIDAVFLILGVCLARAAFGPGTRFAPSRTGLAHAVLTGLTTIVVASPWLLYNKLGFGSFMPISGTAQSWSAGLGQNVTQAVANLAEYCLVVLPIPQPLEKHPVVNAGCALVIVTMVGVLMRAWRVGDGRVRALIFVCAVQAACLFTYYGVLFGAPHFVGRYLFPLSPFLALVWAAAVFGVWDRLSLNRLGYAAAALLLVLLAYPNLRLYAKGERHQHFQVVEWIEANVRDSDWVGAVQTGTIGFFHDRTINLDGKVNPEALEAALQRRIPTYVLEKDIRYLADWQGIAGWIEDYPEIRDNFELVVHDTDRNLAVLRRRQRFAASR